MSEKIKQGDILTKDHLALRVLEVDEDGMAMVEIVGPCFSLPVTEAFPVNVLLAIGYELN